MTVPGRGKRCIRCGGRMFVGDEDRELVNTEDGIRYYSQKGHCGICNQLLVEYSAELVGDE